jgi:hypothetical protein
MNDGSSGINCAKSDSQNIRDYTVTTPLQISNSCKEGPSGPSGPADATGTQGPPGETGATGQITNIGERICT